ncbi:PDZ domain-containing protein [Paenisporosarcina cavernae]|uniref:endopeptidase La n=2 Tax=Paenisporosarcina cavernae TaxID=2320858 RepID=A0A385YVP8_9BACL|nr:PDZ domain-containing protein [Paenisporosarcina cavernae]
MKPGGAYPLSPLVHVENADEDDTGELHLMTVAVAKATPLNYVWSKVTNNGRIVETNQIRNPDETEEEYDLRQLKLMSSSQNNAVIVAFDRAGLDYKITSKGLYVVNVVGESAADGKLKAGDSIRQIDQLSEVTLQEVLSYLASKKEGDTIELTILRDGKKMTQKITLDKIPGEDGRVGLGVAFMEDKTVKTNREVTIKSEQIGGPSAGMMFTLQLLNELEDENLAKGYQVAGTGEIFPDGTVGRIGGIDLKIIAAADQGMEIFFAPDDELPAAVKEKYPDLVSNYQEALATAKKIGTDMKIVPVKTVDDAITYLEQLEEKKS